jgi:hypothetical protein
MINPSVFFAAFARHPAGEWIWRRDADSTFLGPLIRVHPWLKFFSFDVGFGRWMAHVLLYTVVLIKMP